MYASVAGERVNETAMAVPMYSFDVCAAIKAQGRNGSCWVSEVHRAAKPSSSAALAMAVEVFRWKGGSSAPRFIPQG